jgi:hypothetical protein
MHRAGPSTLEWRSASASTRRNPVNSSRRIAARAVAFSPAIPASRIVCPSFVIFFDVEETSLLSVGRLFHTARGVSLNYFERRSRVFEDCSQHSHRAAGSGSATGGNTSTSNAGSCCLAGDDVGLHALNIGRRQTSHRETAN